MDLEDEMYFDKSVERYGVDSHVSNDVLEKIKTWARSRRTSMPIVTHADAGVYVMFFNDYEGDFVALFDVETGDLVKETKIN